MQKIEKNNANRQKKNGVTQSQAAERMNTPVIIKKKKKKKVQRKA